MQDNPFENPIGPQLIWRDSFNNEEVNRLHAEGFDHTVLTDDWWGQVNRHSLGWVCARSNNQLIGFANVAWDGGIHAFLLDVLVTQSWRRQGLGFKIVEVVRKQTQVAGCEWLHVDFESHLRNFYLESCGFTETNAGLIALR